MTAKLLSNIVAQNNVWRGAARVVYAASSQSFPGKLESIIAPSTPKDPHATPYALADGWSDMGPTTTDGVTVTRGFEGEDGVEVDQSNVALFEGAPSSWDVTLAFTLAHTDPDSLAIAWELPTKRSYAKDESGPDYKVAQTYSKLAAPTALTSRRIAFIQQHPTTSLLRAFVFRDVTLAPGESELILNRANASFMPMNLVANPDTDVSEAEDIFGGIFEESAP